MSATINTFETLNAKEQFILKQLLINGEFTSKLRYDYKFLAKWYKTFDQSKGLTETYDRIWGRINDVIKKMSAKRILTFTASRLSSVESPTDRLMNVRTYSIKQHWRSLNTTQINQFKSRFL